MAEINIDPNVHTFIKDVMRIADKEKIEIESAFHLVALHNGFKFANTNEHYRKLIQSNYLIGSEYERIHNILHNISVNTIDGYRAPILTKETSIIVHELIDVFLVNKRASEFSKILSYHSNPIMLMYLLILLEIFPTSDKNGLS